MDVTINIPDPQVSRVIDALVGLTPVPLADNGTPLYTKAVWAKEQIRRFLVNSVRRYERHLLVQVGRDAVRAINRDDDLAGIPGQDSIPEVDTD